MDIESIRSNYEYLKTGLIYFNHASTGPVSKPVLDNINLRLELSSKGEIDDYLKFLDVEASAKLMIGKMINASPERIAFIDNTTNGVNILAQGVKLNKGDHILLNDIEFPANVYPFMNLQQNGIILDFVKADKGRVTAQAVIESIRPETKIVAISQVQFLTGYRAELKKIGKVCREKDIIFAVDAIQGLGAVQLNVETDYIDYISCGTQKWLMGLQGCAFIYISDSLQRKLAPKMLGWLSVENAWNLLDYKPVPITTAEFFQTGTVNTIGIYAIEASLKLFLKNGFEEIESRVISNSRYLREKLNGIGIETFADGLSDKELSGIISFKSGRSEDILKLLAENKITAATREGIVRLAPHYYNTFEEIDKVIEVLKTVLIKL